MRLRGLLFALLVFQLAGCENIEEKQPVLELETATIPPAPKLPEATKPPPRPRQVARFDPETLIGLNEQQTADLLGRPAAITDKSPATVWEYQGRGCSLDVFFFMDLDSQRFRALSYEVKARHQSQQAKQDCLVGIGHRYVRQ